MVPIGQTMREPKEGPTCGNTATPEAKAPNVNQTRGSEAPMTMINSIKRAVAVRTEWLRWRRVYRENHDRAISDLIAHFRYLVAHNQHIGAAEAAAYLHGHDFTTDDGDQFKVNNNALAVFLREICHECPDLAEHIKLRKSRFDRFYQRERQA